MTQYRLLLLAVAAMPVYLHAQPSALADSIVKYQMASGGWPKNQHWLDGPDQAYMAECFRTGIGSTIDNGATTGEMKVLANAVRELAAPAHAEADGAFGASDGKACSSRAQRTATYTAAFVRGLNYLLNMQYANGGWPQFWPQRSAQSYANHITFNDNAMLNVMQLLRGVATNAEPYSAIGISDSLRLRCDEAFWHGVRCILDCQIADAQGMPTVWCQQHDEQTLLPAPARKYELASYCGYGETVGIVELLMDLAEADACDAAASLFDITTDLLWQRIGLAVHWLEAHAIKGMKLESYVDADGRADKRFVPSPGAPDIWARYYDLQTASPLFSDRHGLPLRSFNEIGYERRNGYSWLGDSPQRVITRYHRAGR